MMKVLLTLLSLFALAAAIAENFCEDDVCLLQIAKAEISQKSEIAAVSIFDTVQVSDWTPVCSGADTPVYYASFRSADDFFTNLTTADRSCVDVDLCSTLKKELMQVSDVLQHCKFQGGLDPNNPNMPAILQDPNQMKSMNDVVALTVAQNAARNSTDFVSFIRDWFYPRCVMSAGECVLLSKAGVADGAPIDDVVSIDTSVPTDDPIATPRTAGDGTTGQNISAIMQGA